MGLGAAKIFCALAFDHELSLGGTDDYERDLFDPTRRLLEAANEVGVKIVLFTDVLCGITHERWGVRAFSEPYRASLVEAVREGHDVQLHLHPHWLTSSYIDGRIKPSQDFALANFAHGRNETIESIVARGVAYLREVCGSLNPNYRCIAFRAGGYNVAPETARIMRALHESGIRIDSSIIKGFRFSSDLSTIDFTRMTDRANWFVPLDGPVNGAAKSGLFEVPIASSPRTPVNNVPFLLRRVLHRKRRHPSSGRGIHEGNTGKSEKVKRLFPRSAWPLTFDNYADSAKDAVAILREHVRRHEGPDDIYCSTVSHPKHMGTHARALFKEFIVSARELYGDRIEFVTFPEIEARIAKPLAV